MKRQPKIDKGTCHQNPYSYLHSNGAQFDKTNSGLPKNKCLKVHYFQVSFAEINTSNPFNESWK